MREKVGRDVHYEVGLNILTILGPCMELFASFLPQIIKDKKDIISCIKKLKFYVEEVIRD